MSDIDREGVIDIGYELIDFGGGSRLERFGGYIIERPSAAALEYVREEGLWGRVDNVFELGKTDEQRGKWTQFVEPWVIDLGEVVLELRCTPFGHVGLFAEHLMNWAELHWTIFKALKRRKFMRVLNLFAYTGGASLVAAKAGTGKRGVGRRHVEVAHVDSAWNVVNWARRNFQLNKLGGTRFIVEDARKFVNREIKRGNIYDVIILDPPTYGHGVQGQVWKIERDLQELLNNAMKLLSHRPLLVILTAHTEGFEGEVLSNMLQEAGLPLSLRLKYFPMEIYSKSGKILQSGHCAIATSRAEI
jgi:23S rRNA (cytosine1962-C5)-methyltransferase